jgi:ribosome biogenesis GTPase
VVVETAEGRRILCHSRGKKSTLVVGDLVRWTETGDEGVVESHLASAEPPAPAGRMEDQGIRRQHRPVARRRRGEPTFSESQLARALIGAGAGRHRRQHRPQQARPAGLCCRRSAPRALRRNGRHGHPGGPQEEPDAARAVLRPILEGKATLVLGPSGAGKSTLVNLMVEDAKVQVGEISRALHSGRHTTTATHWYWLDAKRTSALIDSPGFQEFGLRHIAREQLAALMPDIGPPRRVPLLQLHASARARLRRPAGRAQRQIAESRHRLYAEIHAELGA